jgi:hypothetical protein
MMLMPAHGGKQQDKRKIIRRKNIIKVWVWVLLWRGTYMAIKLKE